VAVLQHKAMQRDIQTVDPTDQYHLNAKLDEVFEQWKSKNRINKMANDSCVNIYLTFLLNVQKFFMMS
jgi:hypothetical protein